MAGKNSGKGSGSKKYDRNRPWCKAYALRQQRERNKALRLLRHFKRYGYASASAVHCYNNLPPNVRPKEMLSVTLAPPKRETQL